MPEFIVAINRREVVAAALPAQEHWLPMSNLDLVIPPLDVRVFFCYRRPTSPAGTGATCLVGALKKALAEALVMYYPFAGEVVYTSDDEPELLCNNRGVDFVEARCDGVGLAGLPLHDPDHAVMKKLMPQKEEGVLCVQVTELKCGGVVVACSFDHRVADAFSANMFFVSWAEAARSVPFSLVPSFRRSLLAPRRPGVHDASVDDFYVPMSHLPASLNTTETPPYLSRIYYIDAGDVARIQATASGTADADGCCRRTKLEAFTAYLWRVLGGAAPAGSLCNMGVVVDGRRRMRQRPMEMETYFGNLVSLPCSRLPSEELREMSLAEVANAVHGLIARAATPERFMGLVDWVEGRRPDAVVPRIGAVGGGDDGGGVAVVVSSGQRFPVSKMDFGWGRPVFASYHCPWSGSAGYVMPMPAPGPAEDGGDWVVYVHMAAEMVGVLETAAGDVFRRVSADYLGLTDE